MNFKQLDELKEEIFMLAANSYTGCTRAIFQDEIECLIEYVKDLKRRNRRLAIEYNKLRKEIKNGRM